MMLNKNLVKKSLELMEKKESFAILTLLEVKGASAGEVGLEMIVTKNGEIFKTIGGGMLEKLAIDKSIELISKGKSEKIDLSTYRGNDNNSGCGGKCSVFVNVYNPSPNLVILGAGHVSKALYNIMKTLDFHITIVDDRENLLTKERFSKADKLVLSDIKEYLEKENFDKNTFVVVVTKGHDSDKEALKALIQKDLRYLGVIGSSKKIKNIFSQVINEGIDKNLLKRVYSPIGLDIATNRPEEIAISIAAEILAVKNNKDANNMKYTI